MTRLRTERMRSSLPGVVGDLALAVGALAVSLTQLSHGGIGPFQTASDVDVRSAPWGLDVGGVVLALTASLPLVLRRHHPAGVFAVTATASVLLAALGYHLDLVVGAAIALYFVSASRRREDLSEPAPEGGSADPPSGARTALHMGPVVVATFLAYVAAVGVARGALPTSAVLHTGMAWAVAWVAGERSRLRAAHLAELQARAGRVERDAERDRQLAAAEERARIARDLHDSAGHAVTVIAVRAGAARLRHDEDPDRSRGALEAIEQLARETSEEIDRIVGHLRNDERIVCPQGSEGGAPGSVAPPPGLASIATLAARHRAAGHEVTITQQGTPPRLSPAVDLAAYRIVQEALTNAIRHGTGPVTVELHGDAAGTLGIVVTNSLGAGAGGPARLNGGGHGLVGMRERASLVGGNLTITRDAGLFRLDVRLPMVAASATPPAPPAQAAGG